MELDGYSILFGGSEPLTTADVAAEVDAIMQDRAFFGANPESSAYRRPPRPGELRGSIPKGCALVAIEVTRIASDKRIRRPIFRELTAIELH